MDLLFFPLDTVKTRLQSAQGFIKADGFRGIYKGVGSDVLGSAPGGVECVLGRSTETKLMFNSGGILLNV